MSEPKFTFARIAKRTVIGLLAAYVVLCIALFVFQRSLLYFPQPRGELNSGGSTLNLQAKDVKLVVSVIPRSGPKAIIYFGGNAEDVSQNISMFTDTFSEHAVYMLHYRGYGGSGGSPTEEALHEDAELLLAEVRLKHKDITIIGRSLGSGVAVKLASNSPVQRLVLITPYDSIANIAAAMYPFAPVSLLLLDRFESVNYAPKVQVPTTIIAAERDSVIPRANTDNLIRHFGSGISTLSVIPGVGHNTLENAIEYINALKRAVR